MRQFAKLCDVRHWDDAELLRVLREILAERDPSTHVERKVWEFAMLARSTFTSVALPLQKAR